MNVDAVTARKIAKILASRGKAELDARRSVPELTHDPQANALVADLEGHPHAFVIASIMDRQMKAERAWAIPFHIQQRLGTFTIKGLRRLPVSKIIRAMRHPTPLHRYPETMGRNLHAAVELIADKYGGDASRIWDKRPSSAEVVLRFLEFPGVGPKIATMAGNLLARLFKVHMSDYYSIDVSVDVHVRRVLTRLGLVPAGATAEQIIYAARAISPEFPGLIDSPTFALGRSCCRPTRPRCGECYLARYCASASTI